MKFALTEKESIWLNKKMAELQKMSMLKPETERLAHTANKIRYNTDGFPPFVFLTRQQQALVLEVALYRYESVKLIPCDERDAVVGLIRKVHR